MSYRAQSEDTRMTQMLIVIGDVLECGQDDCSEPGAVLLRQKHEDGEDCQVLYCETHWLAARRAWAPVTAHDAIEAMAEVARLIK